MPPPAVKASKTRLIFLYLNAIIHCGKLSFRFWAESVLWKNQKNSLKIRVLQSQSSVIMTPSHATFVLSMTKKVKIMFCTIFRKSSREASGRRQASPINNVLVFHRRNCGLAKIRRVLKKVLFFSYQWHIYLAMPTFHISHRTTKIYTMLQLNAQSAFPLSHCARPPGLFMSSLSQQVYQWQQ